MKKLIITVLLISIPIFLKQAVAQEIQKVKRKGLIFGASLGSGLTYLNFPNKHQNDLGIALDAKVGYMAKPNLALLLSTNVTTYDYSGSGRNRKRDFGIVAPSLQYWVNNKFWILGGAGLGGDNPVFWDIKDPGTNPLETKYYQGLGVVGAVGYEIFQKENFAIDIKTKITYRNVELSEGKTNGLSLAFLIGVNFY